ncbi:MAG: hypothetical protein FD188_3380 [Ignavibacteria bacterium]|nr:MAG: hypothetical protein FD188_3380 [Ignavibacteria bacterium]
MIIIFIEEFLILSILSSFSTFSMLGEFLFRRITILRPQAAQWCQHERSGTISTNRKKLLKIDATIR